MIVPSLGKLSYINRIYYLFFSFVIVLTLIMVLYYVCSVVVGADQLLQLGGDVESSLEGVCCRMILKRQLPSK